MSDLSDVEQADTGLLELAELVLRDAGYHVTSDRAEGAPVLLAENRDNVAVVTAQVAIDGLIESDPGLSRLLNARLDQVAPGSKRWDAFAVLLCAQGAGQEQTEALSEISYNLRQVRRLVRVEVEPTKAAVSRALRPLLPLPESPHSGALKDPMKELQALLLADGIDPDVLTSVITDFAIRIGQSIVTEDDLLNLEDAR